MEYEVCRPFEGDRKYATGEVVNVDGWPPQRAEMMERQRFLRPYKPSAPEQIDSGRRRGGDKR